MLDSKQLERAKELNVPKAQIDVWASGVLIQNAMPNLSDDDREYILTGITPEEWDEMFLEEDISGIFSKDYEDEGSPF